MKDKPITTWYYDYYEPGTFSHQQELCKAVEWTGCNLEGRRVVPTTLIQKLPDGTEKKIKTTKLTGEQANPLTIRLLALREALNQLETNVSPIKEAIKRQSEKKFSKGKMFGMGGSLETQDSSIETGGAPIEVIRISGKRKPIQFHHDIAHLTLYEFFTNFGSVFDRLTYEINMLYRLEIPQWKRYWGTLTKAKEPYLAKLRGKEKDLADLLKDYVGKFEMATHYRNRMVHDGVIRVSPDFALLEFSVMLAEDPNDDESAMNVDALKFCKGVKANLLKLLDGSYELMLQHLKTGNPPW